MAKGGSGDVLGGNDSLPAGAGNPAQKGSPVSGWLHGAAGDLAAASFGEYGMTPSDLLQNIPAAIQGAMSFPVD